MAVRQGERRRPLYESVETKVDRQTGEITEQTRIRESKVPAEPPFVKLYVDDLGAILGLVQGEKRVLLSLAISMDFEEGIASVTAAKRKRLAERCKLSVRAFNNAISSLAKLGLIKILGYGEYQLNPHLFAKGDWKTIYARRQSFQLRLTYTQDSRHLSAVILNGDQQEPERPDADSPPTGSKDAPRIDSATGLPAHLLPSVEDFQDLNPSLLQAAE